MIPLFTLTLRRQGAEWKVLLPVIKFMGYHTQCTNKRIWLGLVAQFEHVLTEEIRLDEPPGPTDEMSDKEFREHMRLLEEVPPNSAALSFQRTTWPLHSGRMARQMCCFSVVCGGFLRQFQTAALWRGDGKCVDFGRCFAVLRLRSHTLFCSFSVAFTCVAAVSPLF